MSYCRCEIPTEPVDPRRVGICAKCCHLIDPEVCSTDETLGNFLVRLEEAMFPGAAPPTFAHFRALCEARERDGRGTFGLAYLERDNELEALEEAVDLGMYMHLSILQARQRGELEEWSTALEATRHAFLAYELALKHRAKRKGF